MNSSILQIQDVSFSYDQENVLHSVSVSVEPGEFIGVIGPNGAGKTTCFNMLNGQLKPDSGSVRLFSKETVGLKPPEIWRLGVGRTFQITATYSSMTVCENVQMALLSEHQQLMSLTKMASGMYRPEALALLKQVGIEEQEDRPCSTLAYGDLKRVELAVALANNPRLMLMDEPTAGMAPKERVELMALTAEIVKERNLSVLFTEHDMDVVFAHADRILVLNRGELIADDTPDNVRNNVEVKAIYLGSETEEIAHA